MFEECSFPEGNRKSDEERRVFLFLCARKISPRGFARPWISTQNHVLELTPSIASSMQQKEAGVTFVVGVLLPPR
jgi:hypothetical protein